MKIEYGCGHVRKALSCPVRNVLRVNINKVAAQQSEQRHVLFYVRSPGWQSNLDPLDKLWHVPRVWFAETRQGLGAELHSIDPTPHYPQQQQHKLCYAVRPQHHYQETPVKGNDYWPFVHHPCKQASTTSTTRSISSSVQHVMLPRSPP